MDAVTLRPIDADNFLAAFRLELAPGQEKFVSHPIRSLAQAYVYRNQCTPFGIYAGETMVGYVLVLFDDEEVTYNIWHMMIDRAWQGRGYGRRALEAALAYIRGFPFGTAAQVLLTCSPDNAAAWGLYRSLGFTETGRRDEDEAELALALEAQRRPEERV